MKQLAQRIQLRCRTLKIIGSILLSLPSLGISEPAKPSQMIAEAYFYRMAVSDYSSLVIEGTGLSSRQEVEALLRTGRVQLIESIQAPVQFWKVSKTESIFESVYHIPTRNSNEDNLEVRNMGVTFELSASMMADESLLALEVNLERVNVDIDGGPRRDPTTGMYPSVPTFCTERITTTVVARLDDLIFLGTARPSGSRFDFIDLMILRVRKG